MIVISYGMTKSGSTLAFELCKAVLEQRGFKQGRLPDGVVTRGHPINFLNEVSTPVLERVIKAAGENIVVLKVHCAIGRSEIKFVQEQIDVGNIKLQINLRDPREICLSLVDAGVKARQQGRPAFSEIDTLDDAMKVVERQLNVCKRWGSIAGALHLFYNDVAFDPAKAIDQICSQFDFAKLNEQQNKTVVQKVFHDAFTQKNKAIRDRYKDDLTVRQNEHIIGNTVGVRGFINQVCDKRDLSWFTMKSASAEG